MFESIGHELHKVQRVVLGRSATPSVIVRDGRTLQSLLESGHRAGWDGAKRRKSSKAHIAVDTLGQLLSVVISPANEQEQVGELYRKCITGARQSRSQWFE